MTAPSRDANGRLVSYFLQDPVVKVCSQCGEPLILALREVDDGVESYLVCPDHEDAEHAEIVPDPPMEVR